MARAGPERAQAPFRARPSPSDPTRPPPPTARKAAHCDRRERRRSPFRTRHLTSNRAAPAGHRRRRGRFFGAHVQLYCHGPGSTCLLYGNNASRGAGRASRSPPVGCPDNGGRRVVVESAPAAPSAAGGLEARDSFSSATPRSESGVSLLATYADLDGRKRELRDKRRLAKCEEAAACPPAVPEEEVARIDEIRRNHLHLKSIASDEVKAERARQSQRDRDKGIQQKEEAAQERQQHAAVLRPTPGPTAPSGRKAKNGGGRTGAGGSSSPRPLPADDFDEKACGEKQKWPRPWERPVSPRQSHAHYPTGSHSEQQRVEETLRAGAGAQPAKRKAALALAVKRRVAHVLSRFGKTFIDLSIDAPQLATGRKWKNVGSQKPIPPPGFGVDNRFRPEFEVSNQALVDALRSKVPKVEFTDDEWKRFDIREHLTSNHFIKAGDSYFQPAEAAPCDKLRWFRGDPSGARLCFWFCMARLVRCVRPLSSTRPNNLTRTPPNSLTHALPTSRSDRKSVV